VIPELRCAAALALVVACWAACSSAQKESEKPTNVERIPVTIDTDNGPVVIQAEIADTPDERSRGLMFRTNMGEKEGMLFLFPREEQLSFWMRNTLIPLDMVFIRADKTILGIVENAEPKTETPRRVPGISQFVLELNGGAAAKLGIRAGQTMSFYAPIPSS
jgi:uncharacterized protein